MEAFWVVWLPTGGPPRVRNAYAHEAQKEAQRLARQSPGEDFFVLLANYHVKRTDVTITKLEEPLPF